MSGEEVGVADFTRAAERLQELTPAFLEQLSRQTIAFLMAVGKAQGKRYKVVVLLEEARDEHNEGE